MAWVFVLSRFLHFIGLVFGVGGVTSMFIINKKIEKNPELQKLAPDIMKTLTIMIWIGIISLFVSGIGLQLALDELINKNMLIFKHILVVLIVVNGVYLSISAKKMMKLSKTNEAKSKITKLKNKMSFIGTLNLILWYLVLLISVFV